MTISFCNDSISINFFEYDSKMIGRNLHFFIVAGLAIVILGPIGIARGEDRNPTYISLDSQNEKGCREQIRLAMERVLKSELQESKSLRFYDCVGGAVVQYERFRQIIWVDVYPMPEATSVELICLTDEEFAEIGISVDVLKKIRSAFLSLGIAVGGTPTGEGFDFRYPFSVVANHVVSRKELSKKLGKELKAPTIQKKEHQ